MKNPYKGLDGMVAIVILGVLIIVGLANCVNEQIHKETPKNEATADILPTTEETMHTEPTETVPDVTEPPVTTEPIPDIDPYEREMMAIVIYQEAGGDDICDDCRRRVADVVLNRVADDRFPNTIEGVLTQYGQYGTLWKTGIQWPARADNPNEWHAVERAYDIAEEVLKGKHSELYGNGYVYQAGFKQGTTYIYCCGHYYGR